MFTILYCTTFFIILLPNIILIYNLYPTRTLLRLPLLINSVLYINTLTALLLFQCERLWFPCTSGQVDEYKLAARHHKVHQHRRTKEEMKARKELKVREQLEEREAREELEESARELEERGQELEVNQEARRESEVRENQPLWEPELAIAEQEMGEVREEQKVGETIESCLEPQERFLLYGNEPVAMASCYEYYYKLLCLRVFHRIRKPQLKKRIASHKVFYETYYVEAISQKQDIVLWCTYLLHPVAVLVILTLLIVLIKIASDLIALNLNGTQDNPLELLLTLVPSILLLFGSWYKLDLFYVDEEEKSKKDLLTEMLQELKIANRGKNKINKTVMQS